MTEPTGTHLAGGEGDAWWFLDTRMTVKADRRMTGGAYTLLEFMAPHGFGPPRHIHHAEDEVFVILDGGLRVVCGDDEWEAGPGSFIFLPRKVPHAFVVTSREPVRGLQLTSPSGFEDLIAELGTPAQGPGLPTPTRPEIDQVIAATARHGGEIVGPPLSVDTGIAADAPDSRADR